jgi:hypothetical protein
VWLGKLEKIRLYSSWYATSMRTLIIIISILAGVASFGQKVKVERRVYPIDISDSTKRLFYLQLDSFQKYQSGALPMAERNSYLLDSSLLTFRKSEHGMTYGIKTNFGQVGGIGCGYHEGDEPHKITVESGNKKVAAIPSIYDFQDSTKWLSSPNFRDEKINLYFKKGFPPLTTLVFFTGDQSSINNWNKYSRPKKVSVIINNKFWTDLNFEDCICKQTFDFSPIQSERRNLVMTFIIKEVYPGQDKRVAISEINFDGLIH